MCLSCLCLMYVFRFYKDNIQCLGINKTIRQKYINQAKPLSIIGSINSQLLNGLHFFAIKFNMPFIQTLCTINILHDSVL